MDFNNYLGVMSMASKRVELPAMKRCIICGEVHECDNLSYTKRKEYVYWSDGCFKKEQARRNNKDGK